MPSPQPNEHRLDPHDLFSFLGTYEDYPASGLRLAAEASKSGASPELVQFFEAIPGTLHNESEIVEHAMKADQPPYGEQLDLGAGSGEARPPEISDHDATLQISDITQA